MGIVSDTTIIPSPFEIYELSPFHRQILHLTYQDRISPTCRIIESVLFFWFQVIQQLFHGKFCCRQYLDRSKVHSLQSHWFHINVENSKKVINSTGSNPVLFRYCLKRDTFWDTHFSHKIPSKKVKFPFWGMYQKYYNLLKQYLLWEQPPWSLSPPTRVY